VTQVGSHDADGPTSGHGSRWAQYLFIGCASVVCAIHIIRALHAVYDDDWAAANARAELEARVQ